MVIITSPRFAEHLTPPGHPERIERAHVLDTVASDAGRHGARLVAPRPADKVELGRVHTANLIAQVDATAGKAVMLDPDTFTSPASAEIATLAAGAAVQAATLVMETRESTLALVRPPGHHAERDRAMGFCLFNNVAVAASAALAAGAARVAIVDIDVHHGNGTQDIFYSDPRVLYVSSHQFPFYPGTGAASEVGAGEGRGFTVNAPMDAGSGDADYELVYRSLVVPVLEQFAPDLVIVSAGYDAHERDPLASMRVTTDGFRTILRLLRSSAPHGALAVVTEGGYDLNALEECLRATCDILSEDPSGGGTSASALPEPADAPRGARALALARAALSPYWKGL